MKLSKEEINTISTYLFNQFHNLTSEFVRISRLHPGVDWRALPDATKVMNDMNDFEDMAKRFLNFEMVKKKFGILNILMRMNNYENYEIY